MIHRIQAIVCGLLSFLGAGLFNSSALAQPAETANPPRVVARAADYAVGDFFRLAQYSSIELSPNGSKIAALAPMQGRSNLVVIDLATKKATVITKLSNIDVSRFQWINNNRLYFQVADMSEATGSIITRAAWAVDADGSNVRDMLWPLERGINRTSRNNSLMSSNANSILRILTLTGDESGEVIAEINDRNRSYSDVYRYNTLNGNYKLLTQDNPGNVMRWVVDRNLIPRIAVRMEERTDPAKPRQQTMWHRAGEGKPWEKIAEFMGAEGGGNISPIAFDYDNTTLYVSSSRNADRSAIYKYDIAGKKLGEKLLEHSLIDLYGGLIFSRKKQALVGIRYSADQQETVWFDKDFASLQASLDKTFPGRVNVISFAQDSERFTLINSSSDSQPNEYFLYDAESRKLQPVAKTRPWLNAELMATRRFIKYKARDGLEIPAWLTLPRGSDGKNLPLVVHIHGGPWVRSYHATDWGRWPSAQFLASRGYAVLEPEPRGSTGFGRRHVTLSMKQWGRTMQDDITDGALHLVKEGIVDKSRMCLFGGSYGGYATLQGLVKDPDLWRCGVSYVAVTDLELLQTVAYSDTARLSDYLETDFKRRVGDKDADRQQFQETSPARNAEKIKAPVLLVMGAQDQRVPLVHGDTMRDAMKRANKPLEYVVYPEEAHGFNKHENVVDFYTRIEKFLGQHLAPR